MRVGFLWVVLTLVFEFGLGIVQGRSWAEMLMPYTFKDGNIWPLVRCQPGPSFTWFTHIRQDLAGAGMVASPHSLSEQHAFRGRLQFSHRFIGFNLGKHVAAFHARSLLDSPGEQLALFNGCSHVRQPNGNCHLPAPLSGPAESAATRIRSVNSECHWQECLRE